MEEFPFPDAYKTFIQKKEHSFIHFSKTWESAITIHRMNF